MALSNTVPGAPICFPIDGRRSEVVAAADIRLATEHAEALSELMPIFVCGEESAALTFRRFADMIPAAPSFEDTLRRIADDEDRHERLLQSIRCALPAAAPVHQVGELQHFFKAAADRQVGTHFVHIAALDSAVCTILAELRSNQCIVARDQAIEAIFARIHRDEARHVRLSISYVRELTSPTKRQAAAFEMRRRIACLAAPYADALDRLAVDPDRLFARLLTVPRFLVD